MNHEEPIIRCNYIQCAAGAGVAGSLHCFLGGDLTNKDCEKFIDEAEFEKKMFREEKR